MLTALIEDSTTETTPLATVLRRVKVLASRSGSPDLDAWAAKELGGCAREEVLPAFRGPFPTIVYGEFALCTCAGSEIRTTIMRPGGRP